MSICLSEWGQHCRGYSSLFVGRVNSTVAESSSFSSMSKGTMVRLETSRSGGSGDAGRGGGSVEPAVWGLTRGRDGSGMRVSGSGGGVGSGAGGGAGSGMGAGSGAGAGGLACIGVSFAGRNGLSAAAPSCAMGVALWESSLPLFLRNIKKAAPATSRKTSMQQQVPPKYGSTEKKSVMITTPQGC